ncbi:MAG: Cellulose biosynthesis protein BcsQ [Actinomycetota bacterium]|nr:Cellulose biosynthesis protein BcsQ [Actinomycetota bacterium]
MTALTVGVTTAKHPECKRGVATNIAASLARHVAISARVCVVDADPLALDVTTRLAVGGPVVEDFARSTPPSVARLGRIGSPSMAVLPCGGGPVARVHLAAEPALRELRDSFDIVVCDLPGGPSGPGQALGSRLDLLDWLILAVTPEPVAVAATSHFLEHFQTARDRGDVGAVQLAVVCTGDESSAVLSNADVETALDVPVAVRVPQLWGRAEPNRGFGAALAIPELDDAVYDLFVQFREAGRRTRQRRLLSL